MSFDQIRYVLALLMVITIPPAILWWYIVHPFVDFWRRVGVRTTISLMMLFGLVGALGLYFVREPLLGRDLGTSWPLVWLGAVLLILNWGIAASRARYLTLRVLVGVPELQADGKGGELLTEGPYAVIRHPRYAEIALGVTGAALIANWSSAYVVLAVSLLALHGVVLLEERELADRFGERWESYRARVPRYLPRLGGA